MGHCPFAAGGVCLQAIALAGVSLAVAFVAGVGLTLSMKSSALPPVQVLVSRDQLPLPRRYVAPRTPTEQKLADIWRTVLSMDRVGVEDRYSDLGGDSFFAAVIFGMIHETFQIAMPMAVLATSPTIAMLATKIDGLMPA